MYPKPIHLVYLFLVSSLAIFLLRQLGVLHFNVARFKYPDVNIALYDRDWKGSPYVIREESTHLWYENGEFSLNENHHSSVINIVDKYSSYFTIDLTTSDGAHYLKVSDRSNIKTLFDPYHIICLEEQNITVKKLKDGIATDEYLITGNMFVEIHNLMQNTHIHDYEIRLKANLKITGLHSTDYLESEIKEYYISRSLQLLQGYI